MLLMKKWDAYENMIVLQTVVDDTLKISIPCNEVRRGCPEDMSHPRVVAAELLAPRRS